MPRGRKKADGRGRLGGRQTGTTNKEKPLKTYLREHSLEYFMPTIAVEDCEIFKNNPIPENLKGKKFSQYDMDCMCMKASDRVKAEIDLLAYHTPKMQATAVDMSLQAENLSLIERIQRLAAGEDIPSEEE